MTIASRLRGAALLASLLAPLPAVAQAPAAPSEEGARAIAQAVRDWLARQTDNAFDGTGLGLKVLAEGDTYRLELPFGGSYFNDTVTLGDGALVATVKPLDGGRWQVVNATLPSKMRAEIPSGPKGTPSAMSIAIENQQTAGTYDPSLASPSTFTTTLTGYTTTTETATGTQTSRIGKLVGRSEWSPTGPGRVTIQGDSTMENYSTVTPLPGGDTAKVSIARLAGATRIENFDMDGLGQLLRTAFEIGMSAKSEADAGRKGMRPQDKALATKLVGQVFTMMDALETDYTYENIRLEGGPLFSGSLRRFGLGLTAGAPDGKMDIKLRLALEGLESPLLKGGPWLEFIPHRIALTPRMGGMPKNEVMALLRRAIDTEGNDIDADAMALLAANPVEVGIDDLVLDVGPLRLKGEGALAVASKDEATGEAELRATGLDALIRRANQVPDLKMAAPVLIFLKGIGKQEGTETVWHITVADRKVMVNDTDLSDLMPSK